MGEIQDADHIFSQRGTAWAVRISPKRAAPIFQSIGSHIQSHLLKLNTPNKVILVLG